MSRFIEPDSYFEPQPSLFKPMEEIGEMSMTSGPAPRSSTTPLEQNSLFDRTQTQSTAPTSHRPGQGTSRDHYNGRDTSRRSSDTSQQELREKILSRLRESEEDRPSGRSRSGSHSSASSIVSSVFRLLDQQTARANILEEASQRDRDTLLNGMKEMRESRMRTETELMKTRTELQMYKIRFEDIREELLRAQRLIDQISKARDEAEEGWAKDREALRRISTQHMMDTARAEGRKEGWRQGIERGRWLARLDRASYDNERRIVYEDDEDDDELRTPVAFAGSRHNDHYDRPRSAAQHTINRPTGARRNTVSIQTPTSPRPPSAPTPQPRPMTAPIRSPESIQIMTMDQERPPSVLSGRRQPVPPVRSPPQSVRSIVRPGSVAPTHRSHRSVEVPPDGYIPTLGPNSRIALPPPHELVQPANEEEQASPPARASSVLSRRSAETPAPATRSGAETDSQRAPRARDYAYEEQRSTTRVTKPVMPMHQYNDLFEGEEEPDAQYSPQSHDSWGSTRISDYELISPPRNEVRSAVAIGKRREESPPATQAPPLERGDSQMSETQRMVEEWRSANSDIVSPAPQRQYIEQTPSVPPSRPMNPPVRDIPSRAGPSRTAAGRPPSAARRYTESTSTTSSTPSTTSSDRMFRSSKRADMRASIYTDGPSLFLGPLDSRPQSTAPSTSTHRRKNVQRTTSSATVPGIQVEPPSHSPTDSAGTRMDPVLLTPDHAHQPLVFPSTRPDYQRTSDRSKDPVVVMDSNGLPAGFVPLSPATPVPERDRATPSQNHSYSYAGGIYARH